MKKLYLQFCLGLSLVLIITTLFFVSPINALGDSFTDFGDSINDGLWKKTDGTAINVIAGELQLPITQNGEFHFYLDKVYQNYDFEFELKGTQGDESPYFGVLQLRDKLKETLWWPINGVKDTADITHYLNFDAPGKMTVIPRKNQVDVGAEALWGKPCTFIDGNWHKIGIKLNNDPNDDTKILYTFKVDGVAVIDNHSFTRQTIDSMGYLSFTAIRGGTMSMRAVTGNQTSSSISSSSQVAGDNTLDNFKNTLGTGLWKFGDGTKINILNGEMKLNVPENPGTLHIYLDKQYKDFDFEFEIKGTQGDESPYFGAMELRDKLKETLWWEINGVKDTADINHYLNFAEPGKMAIMPRKNQVDVGTEALWNQSCTFLDGTWHKIGIKLNDDPSDSTKIRYTFIVDGVTVIDNKLFTRQTVDSMGYFSLAVMGGSTVSIRNVGGNGPSFGYGINTNNSVNSAESTANSDDSPITNDNLEFYFLTFVLFLILTIVVMSRNKKFN